MTDEKEKYNHLRRSAMHGKMPKRTDLSFSDRLKYCQLRLLHEYPDDKKIEEVIGRSMKQLGRYIQGNDIPLLVLAKLCEYSRVPIEWVVENEVANSRVTSLPDFVDNFWNVPQHIGQTCVEKDVDQDDVLPKPLKAPTPKELPAIKLEVFRAVGRLVVSLHKSEGIALPPDALLNEQSIAYNTLLKKAENPSDLEELESLLPWLEARLNRQLKTAKAEPGSGKHSA